MDVTDTHIKYVYRRKNDPLCNDRLNTLPELIFIIQQAEKLLEIERHIALRYNDTRRAVRMSLKKEMTLFFSAITRVYKHIP